MKFALSAYSAVTNNLRRITTVGGGALLLATSLASCGSDPPAESGPSDGAILVGDANSFQSTAALAPASAATAASGADVSVCWNPLPEDLLCHTAEPVKTVFLLRILETDRNEILSKLVTGALGDNVDRTLRFPVTDDLDRDGCAKLSEFKDGSDPIADFSTEYFASTDHTYMLVFSSAEAVKQGTLSLMFLDPGAGTMPAQAPDGCTQLQYSVELETLTPVNVPMAGPWPIDWRGVTRAGDGTEMKHSSVSRALLAFYEGRDLANLEQNIFDLEQIEGAKYWEIPLTGERNTDLALATDKTTGAAFPGFQTTTTGTWMLALMCDTCASPAPLMLTVLNPM